MGEGLTYVMLYDGEGPIGQETARRFVEEAMGPHDQVAVVPLLGEMSDARGCTSSRQALLAAIECIQRTGKVFEGDSTRMSFQVA